jgi:hypothetical protein
VPPAAPTSRNLLASLCSSSSAAVCCACCERVCVFCVCVCVCVWRVRAVRPTGAARLAVRKFEGRFAAVGRSGRARTRPCPVHDLCVFDTCRVSLRAAGRTTRQVLLVANVSPEATSAGETLSSLNFASRAAQVMSCGATGVMTCMARRPAWHGFKTRCAAQLGAQLARLWLRKCRWLDERTCGLYHESLHGYCLCHYMTG